MASTSKLKHEALLALIDVSLTINASLEWEEVLESIMSVITDVMRVEASALMLLNEAETELLFQVARGDKASIVKKMRIKVGEGIAGWVAREKKAAIVHDVQSDPRFTEHADRVTGFETRSILCVPMATKEKLMGVIEVINRLDGAAFSEHDRLLCEAIANQAAMALENARLHEDRLRQERLAAVGQTVAGLAHCIKNILNAVAGGSYVLESGIRKHDVDRITQGWDTVKRNNLFLEQLVLDMLSYSKEREPEYAAVDINDLSESALMLCRDMAQRKNVEIRFEGDPSIGTVQVDAKGIKRCLMNLVGNAVDACGDEDGLVRVLVESTADPDQMVIRIKDNGCGISLGDQEKLFRIFFSTKGSKGTGLGLPVTNKIVQEHGGTIDVESKPGRGTTFIVTLPKERKTNAKNSGS